MVTAWQSRRAVSRPWLVLLLILALGVAGFKLARPHRTTSTVQLSPSSTPTDLSWQLTLPSLKVTAPIVLNVDGNDEGGYLKALEGGVAHYQGTALPGASGNSVIFGHSAYYKNKPGAYKEIFKSLGSVKKGDQITVSGQGQRWNYRVTVSRLIADDDFSVLEATAKPTLTLLTCWPPGTIEKRWLVQALRED